MSVTHSLDLEASSSQYASITDGSQSGLDLSTALTLEAWLDIESVAGNYIITKFDTNSQRSYALYVDSSKYLILYVSDDGTFDSGHSLTITADLPVEISAWIHVAFAFDVASETGTLYVNGESIPVTNTGTGIGASLYNSTAPFAIGVRFATGAATGYFDGKIRNVRVWSDIRTQAEVRANMNMDAPVDTTGLVSNWLLNNDYTDSQGSNDLTASGSPVFATNYPDSLDLVENGGWLNRHKIVIDNTKVSGSSDFTNIPIVLTEDNFLAEVFSNSINGGDDLRFSTDIYGKNRLAHEVVSWNTSTNTGEIWVKINTLSYNADTEIYVHYNNSGASPLNAAEAFGQHHTWPSTYKGVWHLQANSDDSTVNGRDGSDTAVTYTTGKVKNAGDADGSTTTTTISDTGLPSGSNARTFMGWINIDNAQSFPGILGYGTATSNNASLFALDTNGTKLQFGKYGANATESNTALSLDTWYHVTFVVSGTSVQYYLNGVDDGNPSLAGIDTTVGSFGRIFRAYSGGQSFDGLLDELQLLNVAASIDYVKTAYNNQNNPAAFATPISNFIPKVLFI